MSIADQGRRSLRVQTHKKGYLNKKASSQRLFLCGDDWIPHYNKFSDCYFMFFF
jgi:hypothetical protein